jgi:methyl-accepting chemotaxis protein
VTDIMGEITAASLEQSSGIEQVNQAIVQMDQVTQQNAALVEEAAAAAEAMTDQAAQLSQVVSVFKLNADAMAGTATRTSAPARKPAARPVVAAPALRQAARPALKQPPRAPAKAAPAVADEWEEF